MQAIAGCFADAVVNGRGYTPAYANRNAFGVTYSFRHNLTGYLRIGFPCGIRVCGSQRIPFGYLISSIGKGGKHAAFSFLSFCLPSLSPL